MVYPLIKTDTVFTRGKNMDFKLKRFEKALEVSRIANIHYYEFTKQYNTSPNSHAFRELVYVDNGEIRVKAENFSGVLQKNQLIIHREDEIHSLTCGNDNAPNVIIIGFECKSPELDVFASDPAILTSELQKTLTEIIKEGRNVFLPPYDIPDQKDMKKRKDYLFGADQMIKLKMEMFLIELIRGSFIESHSDEVHPSDKKIYQVYDYITENFKQNISLNELCFLFNTNKTTLCYSFKKVYGITVVNYIHTLKIKEAKKLIREGNMNLTEISESVGFASLHYFSRLFKKYENKSPSEYIETIKARLNL